MAASNMLMIYALFVLSLGLMSFFWKKINGWLRLLSVLLLIVYGVSMVFVSVIVVSSVYERDVKRRSSLTHIIDRVVLRGVSNGDSGTTPMENKSNESCMELVENENLRFDDLMYGGCTFREGATNAQFDRLWWLGRDRVIIKFPNSAYRIPWIQEKVDSAIQNPCKYLPQDGKFLADWKSLKCDNGLKQNLTTLLVLIDDKKQPVERKWFYRYKWESWFP